MTLKLDLLQTGYLPDNLPPSFHTEAVAAYLGRVPTGSYLSEGGDPVRPATYNASKRGLSRRNFSAIHPITAHDLAEFLDSHSAALGEFFANSASSLSIPRHTPDSDRALEIASHSELEEQRLIRLSGYRFIAKTDISRFYHSIYTHSVPWAFHGKAAAKRDRQRNSFTIFCNRLDHVLRQGQDGQTIGIPVGPDASRYIAEFISIAIDREFVRRCDVTDYSMVRHVDDVWIGAHTHADAERALWRYREAIREFELDINETKTRIYAENYHFSDAWPSDVSNRLELAIDSSVSRREERLRAALEFAFSQSVAESDDGILKYAIRQLDRSDIHWDVWSTFQPFLMRSAIHFGHTVDYAVRVLVWRELAIGDLDHARWTTILHSILDRQSRLGNDSETCWALFASLRLGIAIPDEIARNVVNNCGALSIVALLNCVEPGLASRTVFDSVFDLLGQETASGPMWPVFLEWGTKGWPRLMELTGLAQNDIIQSMTQQSVSLFDADRLTRVFSGITGSNFGTVRRAIEARVGAYDNEPDEEEEEEEEEEEQLF
ncbi:MAG: RNA-directed DNA polymerase [Planctomycetota bacterium]